MLWHLDNGITEEGYTIWTQSNVCCDYILMLDLCTLANHHSLNYRYIYVLLNDIQDENIGLVCPVCVK